MRFYRSFTSLLLISLLILSYNTFADNHIESQDFDIFHENNLILSMCPNELTSGEIILTLKNNNSLPINASVIGVTKDWVSIYMKDSTVQNNNTIIVSYSIKIPENIKSDLYLSELILFVANGKNYSVSIPIAITIKERCIVNTKASGVEYFYESDKGFLNLYLLIENLNSKEITKYPVELILYDNQEIIYKEEHNILSMETIASQSSKFIHYTIPTHLTKGKYIAELYVNSVKVSKNNFSVDKIEKTALEKNMFYGFLFLFLLFVLSGAYYLNKQRKNFN